MNITLAPITSYEDYKKEFRDRSLFDCGSRASVAHQLELDYLRAGIDLSRYVERHRVEVGKLWNYVGD